MEEDAEDASNGSGDVWDESLEAPFWDLVGKLLKFGFMINIKMSFNSNNNFGFVWAICIPCEGNLSV